MKSFLLCVTVAATAIAAGTVATAQQRPAGGGGTANYWMSAETVSGMAAQSQAGQGSMIGAMMSGRGPGSQSYVRNLTLQLGSPRRPTGAPSAEHLPPTVLNAGPSLPLVSPEARPTPRNERPTQWGAGDGGARGRILYYWGCGDRVRQGQPVEIDLSRLQPGQVPPGMTAGLNVRTMTPPSSGTAGTYGEWPNSRSRVQIPANGSLVGDHVIRGNYSPEIRFALAQNQDFLAPITITSNTAAASGAVPVAWRAVPNARAYFLSAVGSREDGTIVMWTSSEVQFNQASLDYLSQEEIARLVQQRVLLNAQTTQCTVPAEVARSVQAASLMMTAFGPEANFSHPARPANAPRGWAPDWTVKLRTRSAYMGMLGMDMAAMMRGEDGGDGGDARQSQAEQPRRRRSLGDRLRERLIGQ